jgi:imidazolonepropionase
MKKLIFPFRQVLPMRGLPLKGAISDNQLKVLENQGVVIENGKIALLDNAEKLAKQALAKHWEIEEMTEDLVLLPGLVDCHTHICFAGSRAQDYALRVSGTPYLEIAKRGGGIWYSVQKTREASLEELVNSLTIRALRHLSEGVTTCEVKSGYGLAVEYELKMLEAIKQVSDNQPIELIPTCLAAHICPPEFADQKDYLNYILDNLLPEIQHRQLAKRVDIFVEETAFSEEYAKYYLLLAQEMGFSITIHADQFNTGGSALAVGVRAVSADHLEASTEREMDLLAKSNTVAVVLPGASLGLGMQFAAARQMLNKGCCVAIATDWNPGSAPMGDLLMQAAVLGASQKLTTAEVFAGITHRAAAALELNDRGVLSPDYQADMIAFATNDYREILYQQGKLKPKLVWKNGSSNSHCRKI